MRRPCAAPRCAAACRARCRKPSRRLPPRAPRSTHRAPADAWLTQLRGSPGAWRPCLQLLAAPSLGEAEALFLATAVKAACQKAQVGERVIVCLVAPILHPC